MLIRSMRIYLVKEYRWKTLLIMRDLLGKLKLLPARILKERMLNDDTIEVIIPAKERRFVSALAISIAGKVNSGYLEERHP